MKSLHTIWWSVLIGAMTLVLVSCEQKSSTGPAPGGPTGNLGGISLQADEQDLFYIPGTPIATSITATVTDTAGAAFPGIPVSFSASLGAIETPVDSTDEFGKVVVAYTYYSQQAIATQALVRASVSLGGVTKTDSITIGLYPFTGAATNITLALSPMELYLAPGVSGDVAVTVRVYDSLGVGIPNTQVSLSTTLGVVTIPTLTDASGTVETAINTNEQYGMGLVTAAVNTFVPDTTDGLPIGPVAPPSSKTTSSTMPDLNSLKGAVPEQPPQVDDLITISDTDTFWVFPIDQQISNVLITAYPTIMNVPPDTLGTAAVTAVVLDVNNNGVEGVPVAFATNLGSLDVSTGSTNSAGMKIITFNSIPNLYGVAKVWAVVGSLSDTVEIIVSPTASANGSLQLYSTTNLIYADGGMTYAAMTALLKDADNQVISGAPIIFTSDNGTVNSPVTTDSTGQAHAIFQAIQGFPSFPDSATIVAKYTPLNISDTVRVMVLPPRNVDHIVLNVADNIMTANGLDSTRVDATVYLEANALAAPGTAVNFTVAGDGNGQFHVPFAPVVQAGTATVYYFAGSETGTDSLFAEAEGILSNIVPLNLIAGPPAHVVLDVEPSVLYINSLEMGTVTATVTDSSYNLVEDDQGVLFTTSLGSISPAQAPTLNGVATSYLMPSTSAGGAWVKAQVGGIIDSFLVTFEPSEPAYINLSTQYSSITVEGVGDTNQTAIYAHVRDAAGNYVGNNIMVHFLILNGGFPFGGVNINNHGIEDSTVTNGGIATVVLNAGSNPGPVQLRAWTMVEGVEISAQQSLVAIVAGPPDYIDINSMSDPEDGGGDTWVVEVSAIVFDALGNEVPDGISVSFYIIPDTIAQIQGAAITGNLNWNGDSLAGVAFTTLTYHSNETFQNITLVAYCMVGADSVIGTQLYELPLAEGELTLVVDPIAWNYSWPPPGFTTASPATMECISYLKDGHFLPINDAVILFFSTRGNFYFLSQMQPQYFSPMAITGPNGFPQEPPHPNGQATLWLLTTQAQAFSDPGAIEVTAQVNCVVMDYYEVASDPQTVTFQRSLQP
ncbi:MAG TPA: Ig-like domain-containing protein [bacterium]|jgi:hypothetical protein